jgi:hypothetical protein
MAMVLVPMAMAMAMLELVKAAESVLQRVVQD